MGIMAVLMASMIFASMLMIVCTVVVRMFVCVIVAMNMLMRVSVLLIIVFMRVLMCVGVVVAVLMSMFFLDFHNKNSFLLVYKLLKLNT
ncbi:MAG: hypothetical protein AB7U45_14255 [Desulfamplus sp.]